MVLAACHSLIEVTDEGPAGKGGGGVGIDEKGRDRVAEKE